MKCGKCRLIELRPEEVVLKRGLEAGKRRGRGGGGGEEGRRRKSGGEEQEEDEGERNLQYFTVYHKFEERRDSANILF